MPDPARVQGDPAALQFEDFLNTFKSEAELSKQDLQKYKNATLDDVKATLSEIQQRQLSSGQQRWMARLTPFLAGMEQYGKVIEVFLNTSEILAFVWVSCATRAPLSGMRMP